MLWKLVVSTFFPALEMQEIQRKLQQVSKDLWGKCNQALKASLEVKIKESKDELSNVSEMITLGDYNLIAAVSDELKVVLKQE